MAGSIKVRNNPTPGGSWLRVDPAKLQRYLADGNGPVLRELMRRAENVRLGAVRQVGKDTRRLERSLVKRVQFDSRGAYVVVGTEGVPYSYYHHEGLYRGGRPNRFLTDNLNLAGR